MGDINEMIEKISVEISKLSLWKNIINEHSGTLLD